MACESITMTYRMIKFEFRYAPLIFGEITGLGLGNYQGSNGFPNFLADLSTECSVSYCDHPPSIGFRLSVHNILVNTLTSTNINQSVPNLVTVYMTIRSRMSSIMEIIRPELSELSALELENLPYFTLFTL